jgi:Lon protease-like protein
VIQDQLKILVVHQRSAAQSDHLRMPRLYGFYPFRERGCFERAEDGLALTVEDVADRGAGLVFYLVVEIEKTPAQLICKGPADRRFAASHEPHQVDSRRAFELNNHLVLTSRARESDNSSMQPGLLPLFPLQVVLLPGAELPLHIFEDRYKEMMGEVIRDRLEFGVILANDKGIVNTGCTAMIDKVLREYPDGRMDILARGRRRFEIVMLNDERPFLRGSVEFFDDEEESPIAPEIRQRAIDGYHEMSKESVDLDMPQLSFRLAQPVSDLGFRQSILISRSEADRIRQLADFFPIHNLRQKRIQHVKDVAPRNGHGRGVSGIE